MAELTLIFKGLSKKLALFQVATLLHYPYYYRNHHLSQCFLKISIVRNCPGREWMLRGPLRAKAPETGSVLRLCWGRCQLSSWQLGATSGIRVHKRGLGSDSRVPWRSSVHPFIQVFLTPVGRVAGCSCQQ